MREGRKIRHKERNRVLLLMLYGVKGRWTVETGGGSAAVAVEVGVGMLRYAKSGDRSLI